METSDRENLLSEYEAIYKPAQVHLCCSLNVSHCRAKIGAGPQKVFSASKALSLSFSSAPLKFYRLIPALIEYYTFRSHIDYLHSHADKVRNDVNHDLAEAIINQTCLHMQKEPSKHWSEISGLSAQKLAHLRYHEELKQDQFSSLLAKELR